MSEEHDNLVEYRLGKLEEAVASLNVLKEVLLKWDARFSQNGSVLNCQLHQAKMDDLANRVEKLEKIVTGLDRFKWQAVGVLSVLILAINLFAGVISNKLFPQHTEITSNPPVIVHDEGGGYHFDLSRIATNFPPPKP